METKWKTVEMLHVTAMNHSEGGELLESYSALWTPNNSQCLSLEYHIHPQSSAQSKHSCRQVMISSQLDAIRQGLRHN